jgi:hypothetical protein
MFETIINGIKEKFRISDKDNWISERLNEIETHRLNFDTLPFKIVDIKDNGFLTKVKGLYSYISFYHMPWKYFDTDSWIAIAPSLIGKKFFCKIHKTDKDLRAIFLNGEFPQFKKTELIIGEEYTGLIIKKSQYGLFIDIGYHFGWKCGSMVGLLHRTQLDTSISLVDIELGAEIRVIYLGLNENNQLLVSNDYTDIDWIKGIPQGLTGQILWVRIVRKSDEEGIGFLVLGKYKSSLTINKQDYLPKYRKEIIRAKNALSDGKIINCEVSGFDDKKRILKLKWLVGIDMDINNDFSIMKIIDEQAVKRLMAVKYEIASEINENN